MKTAVFMELFYFDESTIAYTKMNVNKNLLYFNKILFWDNNQLTFGRKTE